MAQYSKVEYWNERYTKDPDSFDWYQRYSGIRHFLTEEYLSENKLSFPNRDSLRVLDLGCGNSRLSEEMKEDGFGSVTSVDYSTAVIKQMSTKYPNSTYEVMDATKQLSFADDSFDLIICKGTMDAILCGAGSNHNTRAMNLECCRVLGDMGALVVVSYGSPDNRLVYFEDEEFGWNVDVHTVPKPKVGVSAVEDRDANGDHFVYICKKGKPTEKEDVTAEIKKEEELASSIQNVPSLTLTDSKGSV
eukprot:CAMPEP_0195511366 /NCGR_PEP_ID=MMETSP0794_2-20130614/3709_1 /TAXON_ID=515487 /ORGANISM="Stephanopyxis turris, Strain CCMP 815" /LENGTH=246 /DNA_ID=CAMNT_0040638947 /DNA_START=103 /DNA_END=843 /DNA_ORIENTATION=+